jgi:hypothetical protein
VNAHTQTARPRRLHAQRQLFLVLSIAFILHSAGTANAQTSISPTTNTVQIIGTGITAPAGGYVLHGTALNASTGQPVRHLWVADGAAGLCRLDPDLDSPGPYAVNSASCLRTSSVLGGAMTYDATRNLLYFADNQKTSQGVLRISYLPAGDNGNGALDPSTLFDLGGNQGGATFAGGQTNCALPNNPGAPNAVALDPAGNLWVGFGKNAEILRINSPATATSANFGGCAQFIQAAAFVASNRVGTGLAWIGHDLWGANSQSAFFIHNADTTCLIGSFPACSTTSGAVVQALTSITGATALVSDQFYPATNGNNLYFATGSNVAWVGNVVGATAGQTLALTYINTTQTQLANAGAVALDANDPANLILYSGDDPSALATPGAGRWFQTIQTSATPGAPGTPLDVQAVGGSSQATVSWSPAQVAQPVSSYTVHNSFASNGQTVADVIVVPNGGGLYPATSTVVAGLANNVTYQFTVSAANAQGTSAFSAASNQVQAVSAPTAPTGVQATAGDRQASVTWIAPSDTGGLPLTGYTVTALANGNVVGSTSVSASVTTAAISGLTDGTTYTFTVHASNAAGDSPESASSNAVTPKAPVLSVSVSGPYSFITTPVIPSYKVKVTNISSATVANISINNTLSTIDGAYIIAANPAQGSCAQGGVGVTNLNCSVGSLAPGATVIIDVVAQMQGAAITLASGVTGTDGTGAAFTLAPQQRTTIHGNPPAGAPVVSVSMSVNPIPTDLSPGKAGTINWNLQNTTGVAANNMILSMALDSRLNVTSTVVTGGNSTDPVFCSNPMPGVNGTNVIACDISYLGGASSGSNTTVTALKVTVNYLAPNQTPLTLNVTGYLSFDGSDTSNPVSAGQIRVK